MTTPLIALDAAAAALIGALQAIEEARLSLRAQESNLWPPPAWAEAIVADLNAGHGLVEVPLDPTPLVNRTRCSEDPRLARANDDEPGERPPTPRMDEAVWQAFLDAYRAPVGYTLTWCRELCRRVAAETGAETPSLERLKARLRAEGIEREAPGDREAQHAPAEPKPAEPEPEPEPAPGRLDAIRKAAARLHPAGPRAARLAAATKGAAAAEPARPALGYRAPRAAALPLLPHEQRRALLEAAIAHLRRHGVLVTTVDRQAAVRRYRVTGKRDSKLADEVVAIAIAHGFAPEGAAHGEGSRHG